MWQEHSTRSPNESVLIGDYGLSLSMATESRYMPMEVKEVLLPWHHSFAVSSGLMWMLQVRVISQEMRHSEGIRDAQHRMRLQVSPSILFVCL